METQRLPIGKELRSKAESLGISFDSGLYKPSDKAVNQLEITEAELQRRIIEAERYFREKDLRKIAVISAVAAALSAAASILSAVTAYSGN